MIGWTSTSTKDSSGCASSFVMTGGRVAPKTARAVRDVTMLPGLSKHLREHKIASAFSKPQDFVFTSETGGSLDRHNVVRRALSERSRAKLDAPGCSRITMHSLRNSFASHLISEGFDPVTVARLLGHSRASVRRSISTATSSIKHDARRGPRSHGCERLRQGAREVALRGGPGDLATLPPSIEITGPCCVKSDRAGRGAPKRADPDRLGVTSSPEPAAHVLPLS